MAVSAPHWVSNKKLPETFAFNSQTPYSLQNALRDAAGNAEKGAGAWGTSNFKDRYERNFAVILMEFWEQEKESFIEKFKEINPDLLFIGAMTLSLRGAIEVAKLCKEIKGKDIFVVIGGKHCNETLFKKANEITNLEGSPLNLMAMGYIPPVFDLVFSGDGEKAITVIGEIIFKLKNRGLAFKNFFRYKEEFQNAPGDWIAGQYNNTEHIIYYTSSGDPIDFKNLPHALELFAFGKGFKVFGTKYTGHTYSDMSKGCAFNCFFCSEKSYINGKLRLKDDISVYRLCEQFEFAYKKTNEFSNNETLSLFVEDSIFLSARIDLIEKFISILTGKNIFVQFGCQFTVDTFLYMTDSIIEGLKKVGLDYVALGVETIDEEIAKKFSKNTDKKMGWKDKVELVVQRCHSSKLKCGMFLLWGLGENNTSRETQLKLIEGWIEKYDIIIEIGLNMATEHPLRNERNKQKYIEWGTPKDSPYLEYFVRYFGEASTEYKFSNDNFPYIQELAHLVTSFERIKEKNDNKRKR